MSKEVEQILKNDKNFKGSVAHFEFEGDTKDFAYLLRTSLLFRTSSPSGSMKPEVSLNKFKTTSRFRSYEGDERMQTTCTVLMVAPVGFDSNAETAKDNFFMHKIDMTPRQIERAALKEFADLHLKLSQAGVDIIVHSPDRVNRTPDSVFPNNWFTTHSKAEVGISTVVFYPMKTVTRRNERRENIVTRLQELYDREISFTMWESSDVPSFLEGTGALVIDRVRKVAFAALSQRCFSRIAVTWAARLGYTLVPFVACDKHGRPIYHTNVMMWVGSTAACVCFESIADESERQLVREHLKHHTIIEISLNQVNQFCGNCIELKSKDGKKLLVGSTKAYNAFTEEQREMILKNVDSFVHSDIDILETVGGGGVRCMIAELF